MSCWTKPIGRSTPDVEHERAVAIFDLIEENSFEPVGQGGGPYRLNLSLVDSKLVFAITTEERRRGRHPHPVADAFPADREGLFHDLRKLLRGDPRRSTPSQIEAIDMGRRGIHNEGSQTLKDRLAGKIEVDFDTARRLFTLVCVLYWRG